MLGDVIDSPGEPVEPAEPQEQPMLELSREQMLRDLLTHCNGFIDKSSEWRAASFEDQWRRWQRNADAIYDPNIAAKKEKWQSKAFVPLTPSHRENAQAQLFKTEVGPRPPLEVKARPGIVVEALSMVDQSDKIRDLILREREKSRYEIERNKVLEDKTTYGSGFARIRFETKTAERKVKEPVYEPLNVFDPTSLMRAVTGARQVIGYKDVVKEVITYRGVVFEYISIWDIFPDPKALRIRGNPIAYRYETTYGEILDGINKGYYLPESAEALKATASEEVTPSDKKGVESDRLISDSNVDRTDYGRKLTCYELQAKLPKKWVLINGEEIDEPEKLISAVIRFHKSTIISVALSDAYDGEPELYKDDYMPVAGQFYGRGIPEMLKDVQLVCNETVNQRLDTGSIALSQKFGIIEKSIVDPKDIEDNRNVIRMKNPSGMNDIRQALMRLDMGNIPREAFIEPQEWERMAQERTSITRQTMGTSGQVSDANQTLGGMELIRAATGDKLAYLGMLSEFDFQYEVTRAYWRLIYANYNPEDVVMAIGLERAQTFQFLSPEEVENSYQYYPTGVFQMESKALRQSRLQAIDAQFGAMPYFNRLEILKSELQSMDEEPNKYILQDAAAIQIMTKAQDMAVGMASQAMQNGAPSKMAKESPNQENGIVNG